MVEKNAGFAPEDKAGIVHRLMVDKELPTFSKTVSRVNYEDGCKVYFENGDFVICRFSGTEPLLRIFAESSTAAQAEEYIKAFCDMLSIA